MQEERSVNINGMKVPSTLKDDNLFKEDPILGSNINKQIIVSSEVKKEDVNQKNIEEKPIHNEDLEKTNVFNKVNIEQSIENTGVNDYVVKNADVNNNVDFSKDIVDDSYFDGKMLDLMACNFFRIVLTVMTLGLGVAWGECFYLKYKLNHTVLNGKRLKFIGDGSELFVEQFKWNFLTLVTFGIYGFFVPVKKKDWIISNIQFEGESYNEVTSLFTGRTLPLLGINLLCILITCISFGILYPLAKCLKLKWLAKNTIINNERIVFEGKAFKLFGKYICWGFLTLITLGIYGLWLSIKKISWEVENTNREGF